MEGGGGARWRGGMLAQGLQVLTNKGRIWTRTKLNSQEKEEGVGEGGGVIPNHERL